MASTIYNTTTGAIILSIGLNNAPPTDTTDSIPGVWPSQAYYVDVTTRQAVAIPPRPDTDNAYVWNPVTKTWDLVT